MGLVLLEVGQDEPRMRLVGGRQMLGSEREFFVSDHFEEPLRGKRERERGGTEENKPVQASTNSAFIAGHVIRLLTNRGRSVSSFWDYVAQQANQDADNTNISN
jgi:hypothetical protein